MLPERERYELLDDLEKNVVQVQCIFSAIIEFRGISARIRKFCGIFL